MKNQQYNYTPDQIRTSNMASDRSSDIVFPEDEPSLTSQQFLKECDINFIVKQSEANGFVRHLNQREARFGDFGESTDFLAAQQYVAEARSAFEDLPAETRARFKNDPANLLDFINDDRNHAEAVQLGLANPLPEKPTKEAPTQPQRASKPRTKTIEVPEDFEMPQT